ncbi:hypothetical protein HanPSC8_Chr12g0512761 [Helianthus annuus]|nr:hypothetical protein HanLR1_Chr12g0438541 [Helianthus annuus]KAJ0861967.1 hypothetical protein HanPSC8_Chr12g0512761 [Helianthus annuus]
MLRGHLWHLCCQKRDKNGSRFGFVSVKDVRDRQEFLKSLGGVKMGDWRLKINIARFAAENKDVHLNKEVKGQDANVAGSGFNGGSSNLRDARSYREVVGLPKASGVQKHVKVNTVESGSRSSGTPIVVPDRTAAFNNLVGVAVVGRTVDLETLVDFDRLLLIAKISVANVQYLGGLSLLITFHDKESANQFLEGKEIWGPWFSRLDPWSGQTLPLERVVWLKLCGIPLHLLDADVMSMIGDAFGKIVHVPKLFEEDQDLSVVKVGVLVGSAVRISNEVTLMWRSRSFRIWVEEDLEEWVPDCLCRDDGSELQVDPSRNSSPADDLLPSGSGNMEEGQASGFGRDNEESPTFLDPLSKANQSPMHVEREKGGADFFEVAENVCPNDDGCRLGSARVGPDESGGFKVGSGNKSRKFLRRSVLGSCAMKAHNQSSGKKGDLSGEGRPKKRPRSSRKDEEPGFVLNLQVPWLKTR